MPRNTSSKEQTNSDEEETLEEFLFNLAYVADPKRFFPFPEYYRITSQNQEVDGKLGKNFMPYTDEEYAILKADLDKLKADKKLVPSLYSYITSVNINLSHHGKTFCPQINEYEFLHDPVTERVRNHLFPKRSYLFHGSNEGNWHSIIRNGIKNMSSTKLMSAGQAYGQGIYLSDTLFVSAAYGRSGNHYCIAVVEFLHDKSIFDKYKKTATIFVVPQEKILFPRYLLKISNKFSGEAKELLEFYTKNRNATLAREIIGIPRRLQIEIENFLNTTPSIYNKENNSLTVFTTKGEFLIYFDGYPYWSPLATDGTHWYVDTDWVALKKIPDFIKKLETGQCASALVETFEEIKKELAYNANPNGN